MASWKQAKGKKDVAAEPGFAVVGVRAGARLMVKSLLFTSLHRNEAVTPGANTWAGDGY